MAGRESFNDRSARSLGSDDTSPESVGLTLQIETPENVVLNYQLAGPAVRSLAYMIDFLVRAGLIIVIYVFLMIVGAPISIFASIGAFLVAMFLINWGYYIFCEGFFRGKTIGKHTMGLRVVQERGYPITFWSAMVRNLLRGADSLPGLFTGVGIGVYGVGFFSMLCTKKLQRIGDIVAGTVVITERQVVLPREPIILEKIQPIPHQEMGSFVPVPRVLAMIEEFLGRRYVLSHDRGHDLAGILASRLAERLEFQGDPKLVQQYPMAFLARIYVTFLQQSEDEDDGLFFTPKVEEPRRARPPAIPTGWYR